MAKRSKAAGRKKTWKELSPMAKFGTVTAALVQLWIGAVKGASFDIHYLVQDPVTGEDCVKASSHLAFVDEATGRVVRLTPEQKAKLEQFTAR